MRVRSSFNPKPTAQKVRARARGLQATLPEQLRRAGRLVSVSLATSAIPYGLGSDVRTTLEHAIMNQVRRCYATPGQVFEAFKDKNWARAFWQAMQKGNYATAQKIMQLHCPKFANKEIKAFDHGDAHRKARNRRGRVPRTQQPAFVVRKTRSLLTYIKHEVKQAGFGKGGWAGCAKILGGTRGLPHWVTHHKAPATVLEDSNATHPTITLINDVDYAEDLLEQTERDDAVRIGLGRLSEALIKEERALARAHPVS